MRNKKLLIAVVALVILMSTGVVFAATQQSNGQGNQYASSKGNVSDCVVDPPSLPAEEVDINTETKIMTDESSASLEEMMVAAIEDEYKAEAEYEALIETFGAVKPFTNIVEAEASHIKALETLFAAYDFTVPANNGSTFVAVPNTIEEALQTGIDAEIKNIAIYEDFLKQDLPQEVEDTFTALMKASENHLAAFQRNLDRQ